MLPSGWGLLDTHKRGVPIGCDLQGVLPPLMERRLLGPHRSASLCAAALRLVLLASSFLLCRPCCPNPDPATGSLPDPLPGPS
ncbi:hypothetical protein ACFUIW_09080 [Streptomyces sp. NPDC057245]|uniref:hypothetical protein n=1 Tax=Streptomyces sp. NPDC057245 TaxID=3346065 RepID=UPI003638CEE2